MDITTELIKKLRDETGVSVMLCRKALEEAKGDSEKAKVILQRKGADAALKKARALSGTEREEFRRKLGSFLMRRGFSYELAGRTVERLWLETRKSG